MSLLAKRELRSSVRAILHSLDEQSLAYQSERVCEKVLQHPKFAEASIVSVYLSMKGRELDTTCLIKWILRTKKENTDKNKRLFIPLILPATYSTERRSFMRMVELKSEEDWLSLRENSWGIKEPSLDDLDSRTSLENILASGSDNCLMLVPGVAFGLDGSRLGHGRGYYDRYLRDNCSHSENFYSIGLALHEQIVEDIPMNANDVILNEVIVT